MFVIRDAEDRGALVMTFDAPGKTHFDGKRPWLTESAVVAVLLDRAKSESLGEAWDEDGRRKLTLLTELQELCNARAKA